MTQIYIPDHDDSEITSNKAHSELQNLSTATQSVSDALKEKTKQKKIGKITTTIQIIQERLFNTLKKTAKSDKYVRLCCNIIKIVRLQSPENKKKYSKLYKELLVLRQVFRWDGLYETIQEFHEDGGKIFSREEILMTLFKIFMMFGDVLDRVIFALELMEKKQYQEFLAKIQKVESDCYFIQCIVWLFYHVVTLRNTEQGKKKKIKIAKIAKYLIDSITSHCKFSKRVFELNPKYAAYLGIISSLLGLYTILL